MTTDNPTTEKPAGEMTAKELLDRVIAAHEAHTNAQKAMNDAMSLFNDACYDALNHIACFNGSIVHNGFIIEINSDYEIHRYNSNNAFRISKAHQPMLLKDIPPDI